MEKKKTTKQVTPKAEVFFSLLLISADEVSNTIITTNHKSGSYLKNIQKVIKVGPHVKAENGLNIKPGDEILLNTGRLYDDKGNLKPGATIGEYICFDNKTGKFDGFEKKTNNTGYFLIDSRTILCKV